YATLSFFAKRKMELAINSRMSRIVTEIDRVNCLSGLPVNKSELAWVESLAGLHIIHFERSDVIADNPIASKSDIKATKRLLLNSELKRSVTVTKNNSQVPYTSEPFINSPNSISPIRIPV